jgi:signal transduction histidine kinase
MKREILVIGDDAARRASFVRLLEADYVVREAATPGAAVEQLVTNPNLRVLILALPPERATPLFEYLGNGAREYRIIVVNPGAELLAAELPHAVSVFHYIPKADTGTEQSIRFSIAQAFSDLERERLRERLAVAERNAALSLLVSAVAHEINNTCGIIPANVGIIRRQLGDGATPVESMLDRIEGAALQATEFARELSGFSRTGVEDPQPLDINRVIADAAATIRADIERHPTWQGVQLGLDLAASPLVCLIFRTPFMQIVRNILINAYHALEGRDNGSICVSSAQGAGRWAGTAVVHFQDNGPGILPEDQGRIFGAGFSTKSTGTGIGLWLARTQLELVGGSINVDDSNKEGATFVVAVPLADRHGGQLGDWPPSPPGSEAPG